MKIFTEHPHWKHVLEVCTQLTRNGYRAFLAGGCVRDALLGTKPNDFDIATDASPDQVQELFPESLDVGKNFGVIIIPFDSFQIEVATFREDLDYNDGRRPTGIKFSSPEQDAKRRDFTVNALFYDWVDNKVLDFVGGVVDLEKRILRCVGEPSLRFSEDHLRIVRAIRFHAQLGFDIEPKTYQAIKDQSKLVDDISKERVREELLKLLKTKRRSRGAKILLETGVLEALFPKLKSFVSSASYDRSLDALDQKFELTSEENLWAVWCLYFPKENLKVKGFLKDLKCSNYTVSYVEKLVEAYWQSLGGAKPSVLIKLVAQFGHDLLELHRIQGSVDSSLGRWTELSQIPMNLPEAWISSEDIKRAGVLSGPLFGKLLEETFDKQLNGEFHSRDEALKWLTDQSKS